MMTTSDQQRSGDGEGASTLDGSAARSLPSMVVPKLGPEHGAAELVRVELARHRDELVAVVSALLAERAPPAAAATGSAPREEGELNQQRQWYREVLDQAIRENQLAGAILILLCTAIAVVGVSILVYGATTKEPLTALLGALPSAMIWPAVSAARKTRHENIALRTLGLALVSAQSSQQALTLVTDFFGSAFVISARQAKR